MRGFFLVLSFNFKPFRTLSSPNYRRIVKYKTSAINAKDSLFKQISNLSFLMI